MKISAQTTKRQLMTFLFQRLYTVKRTEKENYSTPDGLLSKQTLPFAGSHPLRMKCTSVCGWITERAGAQGPKGFLFEVTVNISSWKVLVKSRNVLITF